MLAEDSKDVKDINGEQAIPDLMLYREFAEREQGRFEHLVIELKRPNLFRPHGPAW